MIYLLEQFDNNSMMDVSQLLDDQMELAKMYIIIQPNAESYSMEESLEKGTAFPGLYRPYEKIKNI